MWAALLGRIPELIPDVKSKLICVSNTKKHHIIMLSRFFLRENFSENKSSRWKCLKYILLEKFCCPSSKIIQKKFIRKYFIYLFYLYKNYFCLFVFLSFCYMVANFESSYRVTVCALIIPLCFPRRHTRKALSRYSPHIPGHMSFSP